MIKTYICHPYADDPYQNEMHVLGLCVKLVQENPLRVPIAPQIYLPRFLDDSIPGEREAAMMMCLELALMCDEIWVCAEPGEESAGMKQEIEHTAGIVPQVWVPRLRRRVL